MIRSITHTIYWIFGLFVVYLLVSRLLITAIQFYPQQFVSSIQSMTGSHVHLESIDIEQNWLGFQATLKNLSVESAAFQFQAKRLKVDINTISMLIPAVGYGDFLEIEKAAYQNKLSAHLPANSPPKPIEVEELIKVDANISRLWKRVNLQDVVLTEVTRPGLSIQFHDFQSINAARLTVASEFSLRYKEILDYERFNFKSSFLPNIWGDIETGEFSLSSFKPLRIERLDKLLSLNWQKVLPDGEVLVDLKGKIVQSQLSDMKLNLSTQALKWTQNHEKLPSSLGLQFVWTAEQQNFQKQLKDWRFRVSKIQIDNRFIDTVSPMELYFSEDGFLHFNAEYFDIEPFRVLVKSLISNPHVGALFDRTAYLSLSNLKGKLDWKTLNIPELSIYFDKLDVPVTDYPGFSLQKVQIQKTQTSIQIFSPKPIWVMSPRVHNRPMRIDVPKHIVFSYDAQEDVWQLPKTQFLVDKMPLALALTRLNATDIDSHFSIKVAKMSKLKQYLPYPLMSKKLQAWLKNSLQGGENIVVNGQIKGILKDFPFTQSDGEFAISALVEKAVLKFNPEWPKLTDFNAKLLYKPHQLTISTNKVNLGAGVLAKDVIVRIPGLDQHDVALSIQGNVHTKLHKAVKYLSYSPIAKKLGMQTFFNGSTKFSGNSAVSLEKIWVPISGYDDQSEQVKGHVDFTDAAVKLSNQLHFKKVKGRLSFTEKQVSSDKLTFSFLNGKGAAKVMTNPKTRQVSVVANGRLLQSSNKWFSKPIPWHANLRVPFKSAKASNITVNAEAQLDQAHSLLPAPLDRKALLNKKAGLKLSIVNDKVKAHAVIPGLVESNFVLKKSHGQYVVVNNQLELGRHTASLKKSKDSYIEGRIESLDLDSWIPILKAINPFKSDSASIKHEWGDARVFLKKAKILGHGYTDLMIESQTIDNKPIQVGFSNDELKGYLAFESRDLIKVNLERFKFYPSSNSKLKTTELEAIKTRTDCLASSFSNLELPTIVFNGQNLQVDDRLVDTLSFTLTDKKQSFIVNDIQGSFGNHAGTIQASYQFNKETNQSLFDATLLSKDVSAVTRFLKLNQGFTGKSANVALTMNWQGGPECFSSKTATGRIHFKVKDGSIEDVEPGFARLIGLLSVESLVRRLQLDIKDVTNKGMVYDQIKGSGELNHGVLQLKQFDLTAPAANVKLQGQVDIVKQQFELMAKITPKVGATIPTIAALAGAANPLAALAVYTLMKVIPSVNENLISYKYTVKGPWKNPKIKQKGGNVEKESPKQSDSLLDIE